jgi:hypothetical protein
MPAEAIDPAKEKIATVATLPTNDIILESAPRDTISNSVRQLTISLGYKYSRYWHVVPYIIWAAT